MTGRPPGADKAAQPARRPAAGPAAGLPDRGSGPPGDTGPPADAAAGPAGSVAAPPDRAAPVGAGGAWAGRTYNRYKAGFFLLAGFAVIAAAAWVLFGSRFLVVRSVEVTGTRLVPKSEVLAAAGIPDGLPLARLNTGAVARRVDRIIQVQSTSVSRDWPDRVVITVRERKPAVAVPAGGLFDLVDPSGLILQQVLRPPAGVPRFIPYGPLPGNPGIRAAAGVLGHLPARLARRVQSVTVPSPDAVTLHLSGGVTVDWGSSGMTAQKLRVLAILMRTHARYYDVSAPGTAVTG